MTSRNTGVRVTAGDNQNIKADLIERRPNFVFMHTLPLTSDERVRDNRVCQPRLCPFARARQVMPRCRRSSACTVDI